MKRIPHWPRAAWMALSLLLVCLPAVPQQPGRYTIEIIVFRAEGDASGEDPAAAPSLRSSSGTELTVTPAAGRRLASAATRLRGGGGYRVLAHAAWSQPPAGWNSRRGISLAQAGINVPGLTGNVVLERGQYLHLGFDLRLEENGQAIQLAEIRRVKPDESTYFDNPQLGVIALVTAGT